MAEVVPKASGIGGLGGFVIHHSLVREEQAGKRTGTGYLGCCAPAADNLLEALAEPISQGVDVGIHLRVVLQNVQLADAGCHGHRVAAESAGLVDPAHRGDGFHNLSSAAVGTYRHAGAHNLSESGQIRSDPKDPLCTLQPQTEAGNHFVKNQEGTVPVTQLPQALEEALLGGHHAHVGCHRLDNHRRHLTGIVQQKLLHASQVIIHGGQGIGSAAPGDTGTVRHAVSHNTGTGFHQHGVAMAVVAAGELDNLIPSGKTTGCPDGAHHRLRTGVYHPHHLNGGHQVTHQLSHGHLCLGSCTEAQAVFGGLHGSFQHRRVVMPQNHGAPGAHIIRVLISVYIPDLGALGLGDEPGALPYGAKGTHRAVDAAGNQVLCFFKQFLRFCHTLTTF